MCLIIDVNVLPSVLKPEDDDPFRPVNAALLERRAIAVLGGTTLKKEYWKLVNYRGLLAEFARSGFLHRLSSENDALVDAAESRLKKAKSCRSDDPHVIALAQVRRVRLLCSRDKALATDFTDPDLIADPRGNVYREPDHSHLIEKHCSCSAKRKPKPTRRKGPK